MSHQLTSGRAVPILRPIHPFPARMAPAILWDELPEPEGKCLTVLDPMTGSGTTVATARLRGHHALGFDTDPLAVLLAQAWCTNVDSEDLVRTAELVLETARIIASDLRSSDAYPEHADEQTKEFVEYWFDPVSRRQLRALSEAIRMVRPVRVQPLLWVALSRTIIVKSQGVSLGMDVAHSRPHKVYETSPVKPFDVFLRAARLVANNSPFGGNTRGHPEAVVRRGDARRLPLRDASVDLVVTSPPYLNAIDYIRGHRMSLVWMGHCLEQLRSVRSTNVGSEVGEQNVDSRIESVLGLMGEVDALSSRNLAMLRRYVGDLKGIMSEVARVLRPDGRAIFVVGDSSIKGTFIRNSAAIKALGEETGLVFAAQTVRPLPDNKRYLPPPESLRSGKQLGQRMRNEVILKFQALA